MADIDALLGTGGAARAPRPAPEPAPEPKQEKKTTPKPRLHIVDDAETVTETDSPTGPSAADAKAAQQGAITAAVDELAALWREIEAGAQCPGPQQVDTVIEESPERMARIWAQRFEQESKRRELFGCNANVQVRVTGETGVTIRAEIRPDMTAAEAIATFQQTALAMSSGHYDGWLDTGARGPHGGQIIMLHRPVVGVNPKTAFRAVNHDVYQIYEGAPHRREALWFNAGLAIKKVDRRYTAPKDPKNPKSKPQVVYRYEFPTIIECLGDTGRGPGFVVAMHREQGIGDFELALPKLSALLRCDLKLVARKPGIVEIQLLHRAAPTWPKQTTLSPRQLWRPQSRAEVLLAAKSGILLPVGVTREGKPVMVNLKERPHVLIAGTSGAGKSTLLRLQLRALQVQLSRGGTLILADAKGADMRTVYAANVGQNLSIETASIHRAITYAYDLMERRKLIYKRLIAQGIPDVFEPCIVVIDEFGAFAAVGLSDGASSADKAGIQAAMIKLRHVLKQGRSLGVHLILSTQDVAKESGIDAKLLAVMRVRIMVGRPEEGSGGHLVKLFQQGERAAVQAATSHIGPNDMGLGVTVTAEGKVTAFKAFYNDEDANATMDAALTAAGRRPRFGWEFPDDDGAWLERTCAETKDVPSVDSIPAIALESDPGVPILGRSRFDEGSPDYDPGSPPLNSAHAEF
ncbi:FtsK/SpoIIIE domain-containing protein [Mycolicibacterium mageritense]|uniref:FtsK/SpoIIIE domain-containing protein n=1 Tax=Mycolicibacterium mageritense TaxID=53462 RepID=UPI0011D31B2E|nr:FtsK/SpoIIIE domain-containing protein [Mycolicibacterium mageritense]TXI54402.1 MAG: hypothetical protein E6Q55_32885 [Mycolicibacterium mageritense]